MGYAEVSDLEARWRPLTEDERARAAVLLEDASALIDAYGEADASDPGAERALKAVACAVVQRAMSSAATDAYGVTQQSMTAGPYTQSWSYSNPTGDLYLTKSEKKMLGFTDGYIGSIRPHIRPYGRGVRWCESRRCSRD